MHSWLARRIHTGRTGQGISLLLLVWLLAGDPVSAQTMGFIREVTDLSLLPPAPETGQVAIPVEIITPPEFGATDQIIQIELDGSPAVSLQVTARNTYINGDRMVRAQGLVQGELLSLSLTSGNGHMFGHLSSADGSWQLFAWNRQGRFLGWLYQPANLVNETSILQQDFVIPDPATLAPPVVDATPRLPLQLGPASGSTAVTVAAANGLDSSTVRVTQNFDRSSVFVGGSVSATLRVENIGSQSLAGVLAEVYFALENSELVSASPACREQLSLSLQKVLACNLGSLAAGQAMEVTYRLRASEASRPRIFATALVGEVRVDSSVNVVADVRTDSDGDGVSNFNENIVGTNPADPSSVARGDTVIDVMAFYTPGAKAAYPLGVETRINQLISVANQVYADSGVGIRLRPVFHGEVNYSDTTDMDTALDAIIYKTDSAFAQVDSLRALYGGDLVMLLRPLGSETNRCGLAPVGGYHTNGDFSASTERQFGYALIGIDCPSDIVVAHELGHNMGLTHSRIEDGEGGTFDFSTGFGVNGQFATVMALPAAFNASIRVAQFSNPALECLGFVCGVQEGQPEAADAALSLNIAKYQIANYYPTTVPELPDNAVTTLSGKSTTARIAMAASHNSGLSYDNIVTPADRVDMIAELTIDAAHVGASGNIYVLVGAPNGQVYQITATDTFAAWDGTAAGLVPLVASSGLHKQERLSLLDNFSFSEALVGNEFQVYIAYEVSAIGEFVYTTTPLIVRVQAGP